MQRGFFAGLTTPIEWEVAMSANGDAPFAPFIVSVSHESSEVAVAPHGELDLGTADELTEKVHGLWSAGDEAVLIDLEPLEFIDSSGLRALLALRETAVHDGHELTLRPGSSVVQRIFDLTGTARLFRWR